MDEQKIFKFLGWFLMLSGLMGLILCGASAFAYPVTPTWTLQGVAAWAQPLTASGTALPAVASYSEGDLFILATDTPSLWRMQNASWVQMIGGGGSGADSTTVTNHIASHTDPHGASMTVTTSLTIGSGPVDVQFYRVGTGSAALVATGTASATGNLQSWSASGSQILDHAYITTEGGRAIRLTASGTATFNRGDVVSCCTSQNSAFMKVPADSPLPIGVVWGGIDGAQTCAVGSDAWIITDGIGWVKIDTEVTTRGGVLYVSGSNAGQASWSSTKPTQSDHDKELGHALETGSATAVIRAIIHFN